MSGKPASIAAELRERIISDPEAILDDRDLMRALIAANERAMGANIVDLRGIAMDRLEARLDRLEETHRSVIAAAYDNLAGTNLIHRAVLRLLEAADFAAFLDDLAGDVASILRVDAARLVLESAEPAGNPALDHYAHVLVACEPGTVDAYLTRGRNLPVRQVTLRQIQPDAQAIYGEASDWIRSEACLRLDIGPGRLPAMLALGAEDPHQFHPSHGTDLLSFFAGALERSMRTWLA